MLGIVGVAVIILIAVAFSSNRRAIRFRIVGAAFALQALIALLVLRTPWGRAAIQGMSDGVANLLGYAGKGTEFLFGPTASNPLANTFALGALPVIIFFASLVAILYHLGIMQKVVRWVGGAIAWVTGVSRVESLGAAANIFVGQSESPLVVRPYLAALDAGAIVHADDGGHGRGRGDDPRRLRRPARREISPVSARCRLHVGAGRDTDGQDHHAR